MEIHVGSSADAEVCLTEKELSRHVLILSPTGMGKSMLNLWMALQMVLQGLGFAMIDPDGKTVRDLLALLRQFWDRIDPVLRRKIVFLKPGYHMTFSFDPFETDFTGKKYEGWLDRSVKEVGRILARKQGLADYKEQPRRERWLANTLYFIGTNVNGRHLGLHRALDVLNVGTPAWQRLFEKVAPHLPVEVVRDWKDLAWMSPRDRTFYTESTVNWFRQFLSPLVREMFSGKAPTLNFRECIRRKFIVLADLSETEEFSKEQGEAIGGLIVHCLMDAQMTEQV